MPGLLRSRRALILAGGVVAAAALGYGFLQHSDSTTGGEARAEATTSDVREPALIDIPNACLAGGALAGGQPTPEQLEQAAAGGYRTVINLQPIDEAGVSELHAKAEELDLLLLTLPIAGPQDLTRENAERFAELLEQAEPDMMVTCASGNRVGAMFALKAYYVDGASAEEAEAIGLEAGMTQLHEPVRQLLGMN
jgi:uncharacterized protein (TIGR01244 family)